MLKIRRLSNGEVVFMVSGRLGADNLSELSALLEAEAKDRCLALDLKDVVLVDRDIVHFLRGCGGEGVALRNCPPFIREWIARDVEEA